MSQSFTSQVLGRNNLLCVLFSKFVYSPYALLSFSASSYCNFFQFRLFGVTVAVYSASVNASHRWLLVLFVPLCPCGNLIGSSSPVTLNRMHATSVYFSLYQHLNKSCTLNVMSNKDVNLKPKMEIFYLFKKNVLEGDYG